MVTRCNCPCLATATSLAITRNVVSNYGIKMKVLDCKGFKLGRFKIPPFTLNRGELVNLRLFSGGHFFDLTEKLSQIFSGLVKHDCVELTGDLEFAEHIYETRLKSMFFPITVEKYIRKHAQPTKMPLSILFAEQLDYKNSISRLAGNPRKFLSIYCVLSKSDGVIFDLAGNDPLGAEKIFRFVKDYVDHKNGYAILLNNFDDFQEESTKNIQIVVLEE